VLFILSLLMWGVTGVGQICGGLLGGGVMWFGCGVCSPRLLMVNEVLCEGGQELGSVGADEEGGRVGAAVDDELQQVGRQGGEEEGG